ncbi:hypothetical protein Poli38472_010317 [Pythium oligandrum]|uniref:Coiled-coil domain-containing protein 43 n=1 Tax=Pythium oligandrum TaxID=41045 RepID=A0A8K1C2U2_PYTOL|nr:hypothetical protein Poli38472_010317 [Pythium oligandrum]|eukprot:TMW55435.1 hypothetical protein Poli38472_010317 [Pythium oligandrum]
MEDWVRSKVLALGLDVDVYVDYGRGILEDDDMDVEERVQSVIAIFTGAADGIVGDDVVAKELNEREMVDAVERILAETKAKKQEEQDLKRAEAQLRDMQIREQEKREAELAKEKEKEKLLARQQMSREELAQREKLISEYGFSAISEFDEEGNIIKTNDKDKDAGNLEGVAQNTNRQRVHQAQAAMRDKMKKEHEKKVARDKELQEKERLKKEKAKKRTMKREKQRGAG